MTNQQREIARILTDEIHFDPTEGPTFGRAIERLVELERAVSHQEFNRLREWFGLTSEERGKAFGRGMIYMAKWAGAALILITVGIVAVMSKKPVPADVEEQLNDTLRPVGEQTWTDAGPDSLICFIDSTARIIKIPYDTTVAIKRKCRPNYLDSIIAMAEARAKTLDEFYDPNLELPPIKSVRFISVKGDGSLPAYVIGYDTAAPQGKTPYYFNDSALLTHPGPQIVLSQKQYLDTIAAGTTLYVDSAKSNDSAWVYIFKGTDTLIWVSKLPTANKL